MAIPDLDQEGFLEPGIHEVTLEEIRERFGRFQKTDRRSRLFEKLSAFLAEVRSTGLLAAVIVNGSFVTGKDEPSDIDLLLILPGDHDSRAELRPFEYNIVSKRRVRQRYQFDILVAREGSAEYDEYTKFFQQVKGEPSLRKGILKVLAMIKTDDQLNQALEQLGRMYRAMAALRKDVLPLNERRFAVFAEGPLDEIRKLEAEIDTYTGRRTAEANESEVWLRINGPSLTWPEAPTSVLTALLDAFRKGVQAIAEFNSTGHLTTRPTKELKDACDPRIVAFQPGSLCVGIRLPDESVLEPSDGAALPPVHAALERYLKAAHWVGSDGALDVLEHLLPDPKVRRVVLNALKPFVPRPRGDVESVELSGRAMPGGDQIRLTREAHRRIDQAIDRIAAEQVEEHAGDLREIDLDNLSFVLRNTGDVREIRCTFGEDLLEMAKEALDRRVEVTGVRRVGEGRRIAPTLRVTRLVILEDDAPEPEPSSGGPRA